MVLAISTAVALLIAELLVRSWMPATSPATLRERSLPYEPAVYARHLFERVDRLIDLDASSNKPTLERRGYFIGAHGYRGPAPAPTKAEGEIRILVLGGSAAFDQYVYDTGPEDLQSWPHRAGALLRARGFGPITVINAGIPGHTSADSLGRLYTELWMSEPDFVVVYHGWNDLKYWHRGEITPRTPLAREVTPYDPHKNPLLNYRNPVDRLLSVSHLYLKFRTRYFLWRNRVGVEGAIENQVPTTENFGTYGPRQFRLNLELIVGAARALGATPVLISQATLVAPDNSAADRQRIGYQYQRLTHEGLIAAFAESYRIVAEVGARTGSIVVDAPATMNGCTGLFEDHVHLSDAGSRTLAKLLAASIAARLEADRAAQTAGRG
jgi:lysophospholipase L1-like esterase